jgi:hypothetical protein
MNDNTQPIALIGDNQPGKTLLITGSELTAYLRTTYAWNLERTADLMAKAPQLLVINNDAEDSAATEFLVKLRECWKVSEGARVAEKTPYDDAAGMVHAFFRTSILDPLGLAPTDKRVFDPVTRTELGFGPRINMAMTIYKTKKMDEERKRREEEERLAREEETRRRNEAIRLENEAHEAEAAAARKRNVAAREQAEKDAAESRRLADIAREEENRAAEARAAAQQAAAAPAADLTRSRGERGGVASLKEFTDARDIDRDTIDLEMLRPYIPEKAIEQAVRGYMNANKATVDAAIRNNKQPMRGVVFFKNHSSSGRA